MTSSAAPHDTSTPAWINRAIQVVAGLTPRQVIVPGQAGWGELRRVDPTEVQMHPAYHVHAHAVNELCLALSGTAAMAVEDQCYELKAPRLLLLSAGVAHGEGRLGSHAYELMWMGLNVETGCFTATSSYRPDLGWRAHSRHRLRETQGRRLLESFSQLALEPGHWDLLQNELLVALVSLHTIAVGAREQDPAPHGDEQATVVADIQRYLRTHLDQPLRLDDVAHLVRLTPNYINSVFRRHAGKTIYAWLVEERMTKSMAMCRETDLPFNQIAAQVGFEDPLYFSKAFRRRFGMSPTEARTANRA